MSMLQADIPGSRVLDLFAGSGALGLETLSRGAAHVTFVERGPPALRALRSNIEKLGAGSSEVEIVKADALRFVEELEPLAYDLALADPPYGQGLTEALIAAFQRRRFAQALWVEHGVQEVLPDVPEARTRRYGDTAITFIPVPE
jgi:16S rRNA (guanine966-N2)-methyltransferase